MESAAQLSCEHSHCARDQRLPRRQARGDACGERGGSGPLICLVGSSHRRPTQTQAPIIHLPRIASSWRSHASHGRPGLSKWAGGILCARDRDVGAYAIASRAPEPSLGKRRLSPSSGAPAERQLRRAPYALLQTCPCTAAPFDSAVPASVERIPRPFQRVPRCSCLMRGARTRRQGKSIWAKEASGWSPVKHPLSLGVLGQHVVEYQDINKDAALPEGSAACFQSGASRLVRRAARDRIPAFCGRASSGRSSGAWPPPSCARDSGRGRGGSCRPRSRRAGGCRRPR